MLTCHFQSRPLSLSCSSSNQCQSQIAYSPPLPTTPSSLPLAFPLGLRYCYMNCYDNRYGFFCHDIIPNTVAHQSKTCVCLPYRMVTIFSNSSAELISGLDLDQSGALRLVFGLNQKAQPRTKPKSEVTQWITNKMTTGCQQMDKNLTLNDFLYW